MTEWVITANFLGDGGEEESGRELANHTETTFFWEGGFSHSQPLAPCVAMTIN